MASNAENSRTTLRRLARHEQTEFSNASILNSMEKFVRTVSEMEETILVPSRLLDLAVGDATDTICQKANKDRCTMKDTMMNADLYGLYNIVNRMKVELLWSQENPAISHKEEQSQESSNTKEAPAGNVKMGHARCPSTTSMQSVQSALSVASSSASDSDSDAGIENDSGVETEEPSDRLANLAAENFRRHLHGLHHCINRMTEAAEYLTLRYQADVGGQV